MPAFAGAVCCRSGALASALVGGTATMRAPVSGVASTGALTRALRSAAYGRTTFAAGAAPVAVPTAPGTTGASPGATLVGTGADRAGPGDTTAAPDTAGAAPIGSTGLVAEPMPVSAGREAG